MNSTDWNRDPYHEEQIHQARVAENLRLAKLLNAREKLGTVLQDDVLRKHYSYAEIWDMDIGRLERIGNKYDDAIQIIEDAYDGGDNLTDETRQIRASILSHYEAMRKEFKDALRGKEQQEDDSQKQAEPDDMAILPHDQLYKECFDKAKPIILEAIAKIEVTVPDDYVGDIFGDMNKRRGNILGLEAKGTKQIILVEAPMAEMLHYAVDLRSMTHNSGRFTMVFDRYEKAPLNVQKKVIEARKHTERT